MLFVLTVVYAPVYTQCRQTLHLLMSIWNAVFLQNVFDRGITARAESPKKTKNHTTERRRVSSCRESGRTDMRDSPMEKDARRLKSEASDFDKGSKREKMLHNLALTIGISKCLKIDSCQNECRNSLASSCDV